MWIRPQQRDLRNGVSFAFCSNRLFGMVSACDKINIENDGESE